MNSSQKKYYGRPMKFETVDSQIPSSSRVPMSQWGGIGREEKVSVRSQMGSMADRLSRRDAVLARVIEHLKRNPEASWGEMFSEIPNHYLNQDSMQRSLYSRLPKPIEG